MKDKALQIETDLIGYLRIHFNNPYINIKHLFEWSTSEEVIDKNLLSSEIKLKAGSYWISVPYNIETIR